jgi:hypothetical protein
MCGLCDTLRNDDDTGDECMTCGAQYADVAKRHAYTYVPTQQPTVSIDVRPRPSRGVVTHFHNFGATGGGGRLAFRAARR